MTSFKKQIKRINPGRKIEVNKVCPYMVSGQTHSVYVDYVDSLGPICIRDKCNAFAPHYDINIVSSEEKMEAEEKGIDWEKPLEINDWKKYAISKSATGPDDQDSLYIRPRNPQDGIGRCLIK